MTGVAVAQACRALRHKIPGQQPHRRGGSNLSGTHSIRATSPVPAGSPMRSASRPNTSCSASTIPANA